MIKTLRKRFILFSVLVISGIIVAVGLFIYLGSPNTHPVHAYILDISLILAMVFAGSLILSKIAVKPVQAAWQKQLDFTADASHELRTPVTVIKTNLELVMDSPKETINSQMKWLKNIEAENHRMARLVEDLLTLSRADTGQQTIQKEIFMLDEAVLEAVNPFVPIADSKNIALEVKCNTRSAFCGDRKRIIQLIVILIDNGVHYTDSGSVTILLDKSENEITLNVSDTGRGIAPEHQEKIYDRFYRVNSTRGMHQDGAGLGLSIAKWIVQEHGGTIFVKSVLGTGTEFTVRLTDKLSNKLLG